MSKLDSTKCGRGLRAFGSGMGAVLTSACILQNTPAVPVKVSMNTASSAGGGDKVERPA